MTYIAFIIAVIVVVLVSIYATKKRTEAKVLSNIEDNAQAYKALCSATLLIEELDDLLEYSDELKASAEEYFDTLQEELDQAAHNDAHEIIMQELEECEDLDRINELLDALNKLEK